MPAPSRRCDEQLELLAQRDEGGVERVEVAAAPDPPLVDGHRHRHLMRHRHRCLLREQHVVVGQHHVGPDADSRRAASRDSTSSRWLATPFGCDHSCHVMRDHRAVRTGERRQRRPERGHHCVLLGRRAHREAVRRRRQRRRHRPAGAVAHHRHRRQGSTATTSHRSTSPATPGAGRHRSHRRRSAATSVSTGSGPAAPPAGHRAGELIQRRAPPPAERQHQPQCRADHHQHDQPGHQARPWRPARQRRPGPLAATGIRAAHPASTNHRTNTSDAAGRSSRSPLASFIGRSVVGPVITRARGGDHDAARRPGARRRRRRSEPRGARLTVAPVRIRWCRPA